MGMRAVLRIGLLLAPAAFPFVSIDAARAQSPAAERMCRAGQTDAAARPAPAASLPALVKTFGLPLDVIANGSSVRCAEGRLLGCIVGANLNCGPADISRHLAGADAFCHDTPGATDVPMVETGHDTIYAWHCAGPNAVAGRQVVPLDAQGFFKNNWKSIR